MKVFKTHTVPIEPGESWSPPPVSRETPDVQTTAKTGRLPEAQWSPWGWNDRPIADEARRRERWADQSVPPGGTWAENSVPTFRDQLASLIGGSGADLATWAPPVWLMDLADRANLARQRGDYSLEHGLGGMGAEVAAGYLFGKAVPWALRNPEMATIGAFRAGDAYSRRNDQER